jgi:hypothetical protein
MTDVSDVDELGPVDYIVVEFPGSQFNGEIAPALGDLVDRGLVRLLDLLVLKKDADGSLDAFELADPSNLAARPRCSCGRTSGPHRSRRRCASRGQFVPSGRIPIQALPAAVAADDEEEEEKEGA